jgi:hypothetical protein
MTIGTSILLIVVGAILAFALRTEIPYVSADVIGYVLMAAGALGLVIGLVMLAQRSSARRATTTQVVQDSAGHETIRRTDNRIDGPPPPAPL